MTSESVNAVPDYTIEDPEAEKQARALARGLNMSFSDLEDAVGGSGGWGENAQFTVAKKLIELDQPLLMYRPRVKLQN